MASDKMIQVQSPNVRYTADLIEADYVYHTTEVKEEGDTYQVSIIHTALLSEGIDFPKASVSVIV